MRLIGYDPNFYQKSFFLEHLSYNPDPHLEIGC